MVEKDHVMERYYFKSIDRWIRVCTKDMNEGFSVFTKQTRVKEHYKKMACTMVIWRSEEHTSELQSH